MNTVATQHKWEVGKKVIVNLPFDRKTIGVIKNISDYFVHVMYDGHEVIYGIDGHDISFPISSGFYTSIHIPKKGEMSEVIVENKRKQISDIDFYSLTKEQVNAIFLEMKRLGIIF